jgi:hypothetical protein
MEYVMCKTGFYNVLTVNSGKRNAEQLQRDEDFWVRVKQRREARQNAVQIKDS